MVVSVLGGGRFPNKEVFVELFEHNQLKDISVKLGLCDWNYFREANFCKMILEGPRSILAEAS